MTMTLKTEYRRFLRKKRRDINLKQQGKASAAVVKIIFSSVEFSKSQKIAVYLAEENEIDLSSLIQRSLKLGKEIYLPVLDRHQKNVMQF